MITNALRTIYSVKTKNFTDTLYYETIDDALDFVRDQVAMDFFCTIRQDRVGNPEFDRLIATMSITLPSPSPSPSPSPARAAFAVGDRVRIENEHELFWHNRHGVVIGVYGPNENMFDYRVRSDDGRENNFDANEMRKDDAPAPVEPTVDDAPHKPGNVPAYFLGPDPEPEPQPTVAGASAVRLSDSDIRELKGMTKHKSGLERPLSTVRNIIEMGLARKLNRRSSNEHWCWVEISDAGRAALASR